MPASKNVVMGISIAGGVSVMLLLAVLLYVFIPRKASDAGSAQAKCGAAPTVDGITGEVTNYDQLIMPDGTTCGENVKELNKLCLNTVCTNPDSCKSDSYVTYDAYNAEGHKCVKVANPTCEQQLCDAPYCRSPSVAPPILPPQHKRTTVSGSCINPGETEIAALCNQIPDHLYVAPDCRSINMQKVIETKSVPNQTNTTTVITGVMLVPRTVDVQAPQFSYQLSGAGGTFDGVVTTSPPTDMSLCTNPDSMCLTYTINLLPGTVRAGQYTLTIFGRPSWSDVNTMQSVQPDTVTLVPAPVDPNVNTALNVKLSRDYASDLIQDGATLRQLLSPLPAQNPGLAMSIPATLTIADLKVIPASDNTGAGTADAFVMTACDPNLCPLSGGSSKLMSRALVFVAWPEVAPASTAQCKSSVLQYQVRRDSAKDGASMIAPALKTAFADLVQVGDHVQYTITTSQGTCKSQPVVLAIYVPPFSDQLCHSIPIEGGVLPPWMWKSNSGCVWYPDDSGAEDYYCAFEYMNPSHTLLTDDNRVKLMLADKNNQCREVMPSFPVMKSSFPSDAPDKPSYCNFKDNIQSVCFTGYADPTMRTVQCSPELPLGAKGGSSISNEGALYDRLNRLITFHGLHNTFPDASVDAIAVDKQEALYKSYYHCGADTDPNHWGINLGACGENDQTCLDAVKNAACDATDRNICQPWERVKGNPNEFTQTRVCFGDEKFTNLSCCEPGKVYSFDTSLPKEDLGAPRGRCQK